jgi:transposase
MNKQRYTPEFKDEAARQIVERGYSVADVSERLGVSAHGLYKWVKAINPDKTEEHAAAVLFRERVHQV